MTVVSSAVNLFARYNRRQKAERVVALAKAKGVRTLLFVGVAAGLSERGVENLTERIIMEGLPDVDIVASGIHGAVSDARMRWPFFARADALHLPFNDASFDLVFSNAVIEHVGSEAAQLRFVEEHARVGQLWMFTTPNRAFPVESHSYQLFCHWFPSWEHPHVSRLLTRRDVRRLVAGVGGEIAGSVFSPTFTVTGEHQPVRGR